MQIVFTAHAAQRIFERNLDLDDITQVALHGEIIKSYPADKPYSSVLLSGFISTLPLHIVRADDEDSRSCRVITVYIHDPMVWQPDF